MFVLHHCPAYVVGPGRFSLIGIGRQTIFLPTDTLNLKQLLTHINALPNMVLRYRLWQQTKIQILYLEINGFCCRGF